MDIFIGVAYAGVKFKTYSGLPFSYEIKKGRNGEYTKELWIDRREKSKSLAWSSVLLALGNIKEEVVERPKALGDIRGVTYIYGMFYRFGLIDVPDEVKEKITREFAAIGNNLNQIAAFFNSGGLPSHVMRENINHAISCIFEMREQVAEMAGKNYGNLKAYRK